MTGSNTETTEMIIEGANCSVCLNKTLDELRLQPGVISAHLSATDRCLKVEHIDADTDHLVEVVRVTLHGITKYGNEIVMVEVDPAVAQIHCSHH